VLAHALGSTNIESVAENDPLVSSVARQLRELRKRRGISAEQLAARLGIRRQNVSRMESGRQNLSLKTLRQVASKLGATVEVRFSLIAKEA
jgi:transcriptional regulator with XRE-family HTH domain